MAFNVNLVDRIREALQNEKKVEEKYMFGGVCFMVDDKMCVGVVKEEMMCRIHPELSETAVEKRGCRPMDFTGKSMKGFVFVEESGFKSKKDFDYWINCCLEYNFVAKASKKKKKSRK